MDGMDGSKGWMFLTSAVYIYIYMVGFRIWGFFVYSIRKEGKERRKRMGGPNLAMPSSRQGRALSGLRGTRCVYLCHCLIFPAWSPHRLRRLTMMLCATEEEEPQVCPVLRRQIVDRLPLDIGVSIPRTW